MKIGDHSIRLDHFYGGLKREGLWRGNADLKPGPLTEADLMAAFTKLRDGEPEARPWVDIVSPQRGRVLADFDAKYPNNDAPIEWAMWARFGFIAASGLYEPPTEEQGKMILKAYSQAMAMLGW